MPITKKTLQSQKKVWLSYPEKYTTPEAKDWWIAECPRCHDVEMFLVRAGADNYLGLHKKLHSSKNLEEKMVLYAELKRINDALKRAPDIWKVY